MFEDDSRQYLPTRIGARVGTRADIWYGERHIELLAVDEPGPRGGRPKSVQVLMSVNEAAALRDRLTALLDS